MSRRISVWVAVALWANACAALAATGARAGMELASGDARRAVQWVADTADNAGRPYAIVDKKAARLYVFDSRGQLLGATATLLGLARGDEAVAGIAGRVPASLTAAERTTPAGRYASEPGHNDRGEDNVWIDYAASLAIHRLRTSAPSERRRERLASPDARARRITLGCVVVPVAFYDQVVAPSLGREHGVVYVLPETRRLDSEPFALR